jgi:hypothetical protein
MNHNDRFARRVTATVIWIAAASCTASPSYAQIATLDQRVSGAERVVVAKTRAVRAEWRENSHGDRLIVSRVELEVEETLKGAADNTIWMDVEGGTLDGYTLRVSSLPMVQPGERAVFFLDRGNGGVHLPHLRGQGILFLDDDNVVRAAKPRLSEIRTRAHAAGQ